MYFKINSTKNYTIIKQKFKLDPKMNLLIETKFG